MSMASASIGSGSVRADVTGGDWANQGMVDESSAGKACSNASLWSVAALYEVFAAELSSVEASKDLLDREDRPEIVESRELLVSGLEAMTGADSGAAVKSPRPKAKECFWCSSSSAKRRACSSSTSCSCLMDGGGEDCCSGAPSGNEGGRGNATRSLPSRLWDEVANSRRLNEESSCARLGKSAISNASSEEAPDAIEARLVTEVSDGRAFELDWM